MKVHTFDCCAPKIDTVQVGIGQLYFLQLNLFAVTLSPLIPSGDTLFQPPNMFLIRHKRPSPVILARLRSDATLSPLRGARDLSP